MSGIGTIGEVQTRKEIGTLFDSELWWRDRYQEIENHGYQLRPRYHPDWEPSWKMSGKAFSATEDGQPSLLRAAMDAVRHRDEKQVMLKRVSTEMELEVSLLVSSPRLRHDPRNHCVPLIEVIELPDAHGQKLMVMPLLRPFDQPRFQTFGEFVAFFTQICDGLQFMHEHNIAHRDCTANSIMLDPIGMHPSPAQWRSLIRRASRDGILTNIKLDPSGMYPKGFHPVQLNRSRDFKGRAKRYTRTQRPTRYYLVDFGSSRRYNSRNALDEPLSGGDNTAPEKQLERLCNPFRTDIHDFGNVIRERFLKVYNGFEFMIGLVDEMTDGDPEKRPVIEDVISKFSRIRVSLCGFKLRSPITFKQDPSFITALRYAYQAARTAQYIVCKKTAIPNA